MIGSRVLDNVTQAPLPIKARTGSFFEVPPNLAVLCFCDISSPKVYDLTVG